MIRATYELEPTGSATTLALRASTGMLANRDEVSGRIVAEGDGRAVIEFPASNWGANVPLIMSALVAGEAVEMRAFSRCRLVGLELPDGLLPGPAIGAAEWEEPARVGLIIKPSLGLSPAEVADVARAAVAGGVDVIKDDEILGDPAWCPFEERVRAVAAVLTDGVVYCPNITGPSTTLLARARRAVELGAGGLMINPFAQGLDALLTLREADLGVPVLAHRVTSGPFTRNDRFGASGAVLARLTRLCGADFVVAGAFGGSLFDSDGDVRANLDAIRAPCGSARPAVAVIGGGIGPQTAAEQVRLAGGGGLLVMLGSVAYRHEGGVEEGVAATVAALAAVGAGVARPC